jgi:hypothetical protein
MAFPMIILLTTVLLTVTADNVTNNSNNGTIGILKLQQKYYALQESQWWFRHRFSSFVECTAKRFCFDDVSKKVVLTSSSFFQSSLAYLLMLVFI